jgi:SAM-dependent methyltransferase
MILDLGCGGGRTLGTLAVIAAEGKVYGLDYSDESVAATKRMNAQWISLGRVEVQHGSVSQLPFPDELHIESGGLFCDSLKLLVLVFGFVECNSAVHVVMAKRRRFCETLQRVEPTGRSQSTATKSLIARNRSHTRKRAPAGAI